MWIRSLRVLALASAIGAAASVADAQTAATTTSPLDNLELFAGLDGSKQPQDLGINAHMGVRFAANYGFPVVKPANIGAQVGVGFNASDAAVHVLDQIGGPSHRLQTFITAGLFQQQGSRLSWSLGYDYLHESYYDTFDLGQMRGQAGFDIGRVDEVGVWATKSVQDGRGVMIDTPVQLEPISQVNGYFAHTWPTKARTAIWVGVASHHHNIVWVLPDNSQDDHVVVYGASLDLPLSDTFSITGTGNFLTPTATGTVDAYLGLTIHPGRRGGGARSAFAPAMVVGNNPEFPVDMSR